MDLRDLKVGRDFSLDLYELSLLSEEGEELAQVTGCSRFCHS
jgi:hypothetical protein